MQYAFLISLFLTAVFLILLVLVQRGKGGGLAGAFGGMGGQSAFGTKAGDTFTRITIGVAAAWILLCILGVKMLATSEDRLQLGGPSGGLEAVTPAESDQPAGTSGASGAGAETPSPDAPASTDSPDGDGS